MAGVIVAGQGEELAHAPVYPAPVADVSAVADDGGTGVAPLGVAATGAAGLVLGALGMAFVRRSRAEQDS
jgi:hypothetical protein